MFPEVPIITQFQFHPRRAWRADFAFPDAMLLVEIQGHGPGHTSYSGMHTDYIRHNEMVRYGYGCLYFMSVDVSLPNIRKTIRYVKNTYDSRLAKPLFIHQSIVMKPLPPKVK